MPRISGHYEWDDDDLTPSQKREGGLHQNLFKDGKLKGSARFIPDEGRNAEPVFVYVHEDGRRSREEEETAELLAVVVNALLTVAIARGTPHAKRLWVQRVRPAIESRRERISARRAGRRSRRDTSPSEDVAPMVSEPSKEIVAATESFKANMTSSEAQARYLFALAARQFSDEQMRLLANARIREDESVSELGRALAELPPNQVAEILRLLESHPSLLGADVATEEGGIVEGHMIDPGETHRPSGEH